VAILLMVYHQTKHVFYNLPFMYYAKCPDNDLLIRTKLVPPLKTRLCRLLLPIYGQELYIHGSIYPKVYKTTVAFFVAYGVSLNFFAERIREVPIHYGLVSIKGCTCLTHTLFHCNRPDYQKSLGRY
jgi:hypothetical protein